jgi:hypothetical protein
MSMRVRWLKLRRLVLPWCIERGCWRRSYVLVGPHRAAHRGNLCAVHFQRHLASVLSADWGDGELTRGER